MEGRGCHIYLVNHLWEIVTIDQEIVKSQRKTQSVIVLKKNPNTKRVQWEFNENEHC